jgi:hypothetical protein
MEEHLLILEQLLSYEMGLKSNYEKLEKKYESENDCYTEARHKKTNQIDREDKSEIQKQKQQLEQKKKLHYKDVIV